MATSKKFALLIDSDNVSHRYIKAILDEFASRHGEITYRRVYGDWSSPTGASWRDACLKYSLHPIQQFPYTTGKNATDFAMIIDAMDMLHEGKVDGFCIVTSDSDFTSLVTRLREDGMEVIGMGERKTPRPFRAACSIFTELELLAGYADEEGYSSATVPAASVADAGADRSARQEGDQSLSIKQVRKAIIKIIDNSSEEPAQVSLGELGNRLSGLYPDFDVRSFGYSQLSRFVNSLSGLELVGSGAYYRVRRKGSGLSEADVIEYVTKLVRPAGENGMAVSQVGSCLKRKYPQFTLKEYGYSKLSTFLSKGSGLAVYKKGPTTRVRMVD